MFTKTKKWLLSFMTLICAVLVAIGVSLALPWGKIMPQKTVHAATTAVTFTHNGGGAQDGSTRYLLQVSESIETSGHTTVKTDVYKNGLFFAEKSFDLYDGGDKAIWVLVPYATLTGDSSITKAEQITDTYTIIVKANTKFATSYHVANDIAWSVKGYARTDMTDFGEISYGIGTSRGVQDNLKRYVIYHSNTTALTGVNYYQLPMTIAKNGVEIGTKRFESYASVSNIGLTCIPYATLTGDSSITKAEQITDTYTATLQKGYRIIVDNKIATVGTTIVWTLNKNSISGVAYDIEITVTPSSTFSPRANDYYTVVAYDQALGIEGTGSCKVPVEVTKDGDSIGTKQADLWLNGASYTKDNAGFIFTFTNKNIIDGFYTVTLKKGTIFTVNGHNVYVKNEVSWFMDPTDGTFWTVSNNYGKATLTSGEVVADDELKQYSVTTTSDVDLSKIKAQASLPMLVSKNGDTAETKNFTVTNSGTTTNVAFDYATLLGDENATAASVKDTYTITLKKGTAVRSGANFALIANDVTWTIEPEGTNVDNTVSFAVASGSVGAQDGNLKRYILSVSFDNVKLDEISPNIPLHVNKNGKDIGTIDFTLYTSGDSYTPASSLLLITYAQLTGDSSITTAAQITDEYILTLKKDTTLTIGGDTIKVVSEDIQWYISKSTVSVFNTKIVVTLGTTIVNDDGAYSKVAAQDGTNGGRYGVWLSAKDSSGRSLAQITGTNTVTMPMTVYKNKGTTSEKIFKMNTATVYSNDGGQGWDFTADNTFMEVLYKDLYTYGEATAFTAAANNKDAYIAVIEAGSVIWIKNGNMVVVDQDFSIYMSGSVGFTSRGDASVFSTMTSFKLDYDASDNLSDVRMRFRGMLSVDVYNYLNAQVTELNNNSNYVSSWDLSFYVKVNNGKKDIILSWTWDEIKAAGVDNDGDGVIDGYAFSAVIGGLNGHWGTTLTAQAYIRFKVDFTTVAEWGGATDIPATNCYFGQTSYSVNSLAEKYSTMEQYAENTKLLDYLSLNIGL